jgi:bacteriorhodopsin
MAMATGDGKTYNHITAHHPHHHAIVDAAKEIFREVYWVRYVNWILTSPIILILLSLQGGLNGAGLLVAVSADIMMFLTALVAAFVGRDGRKWAWYTISCIAFLTVVYQIGYRGRRASSNRNAESRKFFAAIATYSLILLLIYPM